MYRILKKIGLLGAHFFLLTTGDIQAQQISAGLILPDTAEQGERIEVKVSVGMYEGEERLGAYKALLYWDPDVLQFIRTIEGITPELSDPITRLDPDAGELTFSQFSVTGAREWINLINVEFKVIGNPGTDAEIQLEFSKFAAAETFKDLLPNLLITPQSIHIIAPTLPPVAGFTASSMSGETPFPVIFTDISQGQITSRSWDFGDGNSSIDQDPTHIFTEAAEYTITLTVSGPGGTDEHSLQIVVAEPTLPPVAYFTVNPTSGTAPLEVVFTDESSGEITSRQWDFGDGNTDTTAHPTHIFTDPRSYIAVLTVTGPGGVDASSVEITVREPVAAPTAGFTATPTSGDAPLTVSFTDASSGEITSRMWDFGDGSTSNEPNPIHIFTEAAEYTVTLAISGSGGTDAHSLQIVVAELELPSDIDFPALPPVADFTVNPTSGTAPLEVVFVDESSGEITRRQWDFGDESTDTVAHPTHIYADPGSYTAVLTVTGPGGTDNRTVTIVVEEKVLPSPEAIIETEAEGGIIHFGEVGSDEMVESPFRILNEAGSSEAVLEGNISISGEGFYLGGFDDATGDYFEFSDGTFTVTPGQDEEMFFSFAASLVGNRVGAHEGVVVIQTNDPKKPEIIISLQGSIAQEENLPPTATITSPANGASFFEGETITFRGRGIDPEEGSLGGNYLEWASNIDGQLGIGSTVSVADLSVGSHEITLSASDSEKKVGEATIEIGIQEAPPPETTVCSRDFNGSGSVDFGDFFTLVGQFGNNSRSSTWDPRLDLDQSGHIGNGDLFLLADVFSLSCGDEFPDPGEPGANARAVVEFLPSETDHVKGGGEVHIPIKARELNGVTQMEFLLKFEPSDAFDIEASSWDNNSGFLSLTLEVIDVGKAKIGGIRLSAGELEGEADLGTLILKMKDSYSSGTEATVEIVQISLGPTSAVHDVIVPVGNTITIGGRQNQPPSVTISIPDSGGSYTFGNRVIFRGSASDPEDEELNRSALVWNSNLDGRLGEGPFLTTTRLSVGRHEIRLTATDSEGESVSEKITITILEPNQPPEAQITSPLDGSEFLQGENVVFRGTGRDPEQGQLTGNSLEWQSSQDGFLGTDRSVSSSTLSVGLHQITLTVTDRGGVPGSDQISITIREQPEDPPVDLEERIVFTAPDKGGVNQIFSMSPDGDNIVKMTDSPGNKLFPRLSPDGTKIAYQQGGSGPFDLWVSDVEGRKPYKIIDGANSELINFDRGTYTWHPDSRHLFYSATWESAGEEWIYSVRIDGGDHQVVIRNANGPVSFPILNDNGKQLIYVLSFNSFWSRNLDTGADYQILAPNGQVDIEPAMSPDGKHIAWMQMQEGRSDIYRMLIDGTNVTPLTEAPANIWLSSPCWSPDGRRLVYTKWGSGGGEVWGMRGSGSIKEKLADGAYPNWGYVAKPSVEVGPSVLDLGESVQDVLIEPGAAGSKAFYVEIPVLQWVTAEMVAEDFDPYILLYKENETSPLISNRKRDREWARVEKLLEPGIYRIECRTRNSGSETGPFTLSLSPPRDPSLTFVEDDFYFSAAGRTIRGRITQTGEEGRQSYLIYIPIAGRVHVSLQSNDFRPQVRLKYTVVPRGFPLDRTHIQGTRANIGESEADFMRYVSASVYRVEVASYRDRETGSYTLQVKRGQNPGRKPVFLSALPETNVLEQNFPNPFNSGTTIRYALAESEEIELAVYNLVGQRIATLEQGMRPTGAFATQWDGRDDLGKDLASGVYFYQLRTGGTRWVEMRKLLLLR